MPSPLTPILCTWCEEAMRQPLYMSTAAKDADGNVYHPDCLKLATEVWRALLAG